METVTQTRTREHFGVGVDPPQDLFRRDKAGINGNRRVLSDFTGPKPKDSHFEVTVMSGSSSGEFPVAGKKVGEIRWLLKSVLNISNEAVALLNGSVASEDTIVDARSRVEYLKRAGHKGSI